MTREQTTIRLPAALKEQLQQEADRRGISLNTLMLMILNEEQSHRQTESYRARFPMPQCAG